MSVGSFDPDNDEVTSSKVMKKALEPKTALQTGALLACGRDRFADTIERASFRKLEELARGADDNSYLHSQWIKHCIEYAQKLNSKSVIMPFRNLVKYIGNGIKRNDWIVANRSRLLRERKREGPGTIEGLIRGYDR